MVVGDGEGQRRGAHPRGASVRAPTSSSALPCPRRRPASRSLRSRLARVLRLAMTARTSPPSASSSARDSRQTREPFVVDRQSGNAAWRPGVGRPVSCSTTSGGITTIAGRPEVDPELVEHLASGVAKQVIDRRRLVVERRDWQQHGRAGQRHRLHVAEVDQVEWRLLVTSTSLRRSLRQTSRPARASRSCARVDRRQRPHRAGHHHHPHRENDPDEIEAARSSGSCTTPARAATSAGSSAAPT